MTHHDNLSNVSIFPFGHRSAPAVTIIPWPPDVGPLAISGKGALHRTCRLNSQLRYATLLVSASAQSATKISGATIDPNYRGHLVAHVWNSPLAGEIAMALSAKKMMEMVFRLSGLPRDVAEQEASAWRPHMRRLILALYRSANALRFDCDWIECLRNLPQHGLLIWGSKDPYVSLAVARRFAEKQRAELHIEHKCRSLGDIGTATIDFRGASGALGEIDYNYSPRLRPMRATVAWSMS